MEDYFAQEGSGMQFAQDDPSDEDDQLQLKATIEAIIETTLDDQDPKAAKPHTSAETDCHSNSRSVEKDSDDTSGARNSTACNFVSDLEAVHVAENSNATEIIDISEFFGMKFSNTVKEISHKDSSASLRNRAKAHPSLVKDVKTRRKQSSKVFKELSSEETDCIRISSPTDEPVILSVVKGKAPEESELNGTPPKILYSTISSSEISGLDVDKQGTCQSDIDAVKIREMLKLPPKKRVRSGSITGMNRLGFSVPSKPEGIAVSPKNISQSPPRHQRNAKANSPYTTVPKGSSFTTKNSPHTPEFILPEGWLYFATKRQMGVNAGKFDQYYLTPAPHRKKLRSRQELLIWMNLNGKSYDINSFFCKQSSVDEMIQKGFLKYISNKVVIVPNTEEDYFKSVGERKPQSDKLGKGSDKIQKQQISPKPVPAREHPRRGAKRPSESLSETTCASPPIKSPFQTSNQSGSKELPSPSSATVKSVKDTDEERVIIRKKPRIFKSPYFTLNDGLPVKPMSIAALSRERNSKDAPPRSPFNLIQEDLFHNPWQLLISTIFLNCTSGKLAIPLATEFLRRWPTSQEVCRANVYDILDVVEPLGFGRTRAAQLIRFSHEFLTKNWKYPNELYGIGKYGNDSYKIFCLPNEWKRVDTDDPLLMMYLNWRRATEHLRKKFLASPGDPTFVDPDDISYELENNSSQTQGSEISTRGIKLRTERSGVKIRGRPRKKTDSNLPGAKKRGRPKKVHK